MEALSNCYQLVIIVFFLIVIVAESNEYSTCGPGLRTAGVTIPKGDIKIEYGNPLEIFCILNPTATSLNSSSLVFYHDDIKVPQQFVNIVNETTLRLFVERPPESSNYYACKLDSKNISEGVCVNYVYVGTKPQEVQNFSCISYNWESLNCSWVPPKNPVITTYKLSFTLRGKSRKFFECPGNTDISHNYCLWNSTTNPPHRMPYPEYHFLLIGSNEFGNLTKKYKINHYGVVLPRKPENLSLIQATPSSLTISWSLPLALKEFPVEIDARVTYQSTWDPQSFWQKVDTSSIIKNGEQRILNITGLKYAHTLYDIRVSIKSSQAEDLEKWWSKNESITVRTKPTVPGMPPKTIVGNFESTARASDPGHRNIYIYWQLIPQKYENGDFFDYNITSVEEIVDGWPVQRHVKPSMHTYFALFERLSYNTHIFKIISINKEGPSRNYSTVIVPSKSGSPDHPLSFKKVAYDHGLFGLSWKPPPCSNLSSHNAIKNYTIFWCANKFDRTYGCNGALNWTIVDSSVTEMNITLSSDPYQFAVSANSKTSSSGMIWAHCTIHPDQVERGHFKSIWVNKIGSNYMELGWKLECIRTPTHGFHVEYCPVRDIKQPRCEPKDTKYLRFREDRARYNITNLHPFTTYRVLLSLVSSKDSLMTSEELLNTTSEAAPSPPLHLRSLSETNTSIVLSWSSPKVMNGMLRYYELYWNSNHTLVKNSSSVVQYTLNNLSSYEHYEIKVAACTIACSSPSPPINVQTKIGYPGILNTPVVTYYNKSDFNITWFPLTKQRGGKNDYYEIEIKTLDELKQLTLNETIKRYIGSEDKEKPMEILTGGCQEADASTVYRVRVRAVNKNHENKGQIFEGPWSDPAEGFCHANRISLTFSYVVFLSIVGILSSLVLFAIVAYMTRCIWRRCKAMQDIQVKLPPQLELDIYNNKVIDIPAPQLKPLNSDNSDTPPPDQPLLLEKKEKDEHVESSSEDCEDVSGDRESSGCGSGHESVSSSITAGTHITDSGTEADERPEDVFSDSPRRDAYPRQRNVPRSGSGGEGYCILAQAPSGYVSLPPMSNYVKHDWTPNAPIKGYDINGSVASPNPPSGRPPSTETSWAS